MKITIQELIEDRDVAASTVNQYIRQLIVRDPKLGHQKFNEGKFVYIDTNSELYSILNEKYPKKTHLVPPSDAEVLDEPNENEQMMMKLDLVVKGIAAMMDQMKNQPQSSVNYSLIASTLIQSMKEQNLLPSGDSEDAEKRAELEKENTVLQTRVSEKEQQILTQSQKIDTLTNENKDLEFKALLAESEKDAKDAELNRLRQEQKKRDTELSDELRRQQEEIERLKNRGLIARLFNKY